MAPDFEAEKARLIGIVRSRVGNGERVAALFATNRQMHGFAKGFREAGLEVETKEEPDFSSDLPKLLTYFAVKGLTFDTVVMPRLVPRSFLWMEPEWPQRLVFVGITRATRWVYLSTVEGDELPLLSRLRRLEVGGQLTVQKGLSGMVADRIVDDANSGTEGGVLDLL